MLRCFVPTIVRSSASGRKMFILPEAEDRTIVGTKQRNMTDRQTDRQICRGYYSSLHCEQCGRAVKTTDQLRELFSYFFKQE